MSNEDEAKILAALRIIEGCQNRMDDAARLICSVPGFAAEWTALCRAGSDTKALWHRVNNRRMQVARRP